MLHGFPRHAPIKIWDRVLGDTCFTSVGAASLGTDGISTRPALSDSQRRDDGQGSLIHPSAESSVQMFSFFLLFFSRAVADLACGSSQSQENSARKL